MAALEETLRRYAADEVSRLAQPRHALVFSVDPARHAVRVQVQPEGTLTGWIPDCVIAAGAGLRIAAPSEVGTQVLVVPDQGDEGEYRVVGRLFDDETPPPASPFSGQPAQPGEIMLLNGSAALHFTASAITLGVGPVRLVLDANGLHLTGTLDTTGNVTSQGDVLAAAISLQGHEHGGVQVGSGVTAGPQ